MEYKVIWSDFSEKQIDDIFDYYLQKTGSNKVAKNIITKILLAPNSLKAHPRIGQKELALEARKIEYRYIVESNYKIIYSVDDENYLIKIADVFDTRQNPTKIKRNK